MSLKIFFATGERRPVALRLLFARFPIEEQSSRLTEALRSAERGALNLDHLLIAEERGQPVGAALTMHQRDGVSLVWPPVLSCQAIDRIAIEDALMKGLCDQIDQSGSKLAQALLSPDDVVETQLLERHGFSHQAELFFLVRQLTADDFMAAANSGELDFELFNETNRDRFAAVIERTYHQSLDCPFLEGIRNGKDAVGSHQLSGAFDPAGWRLYRIGSQEVGVLLMNEHPDQKAIELVYFGIVPEFRGQGLGRQVLASGIQAAAMTDRAVMFLAVDCGNTYANALYDELGFTELARRVVVRRTTGMARK